MMCRTVSDDLIMAPSRSTAVGLGMLGIMPLLDAVDLHATGAEEAKAKLLEEATSGRRAQSHMDEKYWCPLCQEDGTKRSMHRHRSRHCTEYGVRSTRSVDHLQRLQADVDAKFGTDPQDAVMLSTFSSYVVQFTHLVTAT